MQFATQGFAMRSIAAVHESAFGTKRTFNCHPAMSAFGGKADLTATERNFNLRLPQKLRKLGDIRRNAPRLKPSQRPRLVVLSPVTEPPILMQAPVPGILTKPAPYSLHNFTFELARGLAARGGRAGESCALGSVSVCARAPSTIVTGSATAAAIAAARQSVKRYLIAAHPITDIGDQLALALPPHQLRHLGNVHRNPSRLFIEHGIKPQNWHL
jgi:hypothetical protein